LGDITIEELEKKLNANPDLKVGIWMTREGGMKMSFDRESYKEHDLRMTKLFRESERSEKRSKALKDMLAGLTDRFANWSGLNSER